MNTTAVALIAVLLAFPLLLTYAVSDGSDAILSLPGYPGDLRSKHYSGYITVDPSTSHKHLFYYFVTSERDPANDPVVLWLNGGPGCSSLDGFAYEHGPFILRNEGGEVHLEDNPHTWTKAANVLYLDSPAGVGMSFSDSKSDYVTNDTQTAIDANRFLRLFFDKYPDFQQNDFYITGESYAGVYVPNLAKHVVEGNRGGEKPLINIKGYMVGNGVTDPQFDGDAFPLFAVGKSLISLPFFHQLHFACNNGSYWNVTPGTECDKLLFQLQYEVADLNLYGILLKCYHPQGPFVQKGSETGGHIIRPNNNFNNNAFNGADDVAAESLAARSRSLLATHRYWPVRGVLQPGREVRNFQQLLGLSVPCIDTREAESWLDRADVREAIHAKPVNKIGRWQLCTGRISYTNDIPSMIPIHKQLVGEYGLRALIYNGDHDLCVPHTGSEAWTRSLGLPVVSSWRPWYYQEGRDRQVAGYYVQYQGLGYATIKGAGHMVPQTNPKEAFVMFTSFLANAPLGPLPAPT